jgi:VWFA-related protein
MLIKDLTPEDITITEDKVPAKIEKVACGKPEPLLVGVLVDVSGSRGIDPLLSSHYDALAAFLNRLLSGDDGAYLIVFDDEPQKLSELLQNGPAISAAFGKLKKYRPRGSTALYDGIKDAAESKFKSRSGRRILVVVGDWEDNSSHIRLEDAVRDAQRRSTTVYAIVDGQDGYKAIKRGHEQAVYCAKRIAEETGGLEYDVDGEKDFSRVLQAIGAAVTGSCLVEYATANASAKKGIKVHVEANSKDVSILYPRVRFGSPQ